jgi:RNA polymerase sigma-70 factor (ECF subfamily)
MESLSPQQQRVLLLRYYGELGFAEIAAIMQCPLGTALSHCHRGLQALRKQLVENEP